MNSQLFGHLGSESVLFCGQARSSHVRSLQSSKDYSLFSYSCLLVPLLGSEHFGRSVCIAWNGSGSASRALAGAMPLLSDCDVVHVLIAASQRVDPQQGDAVVRYLGWHGIEAVAHRIVPNAGRAGPSLVAKAESLGCDLFIMGGYGHGRVREMILGGVTRFVIGQAAFPVIMAH